MLTRIFIKPELKVQLQLQAVDLTTFIINLYHHILYNGLFSLGANFHLTFSRNFPDLEIHGPNKQKTHVSNISHKVYTGVHEHLNSGNRQDASLYINQHNIHNSLAVAVYVHKDNIIALHDQILYRSGCLSFAV